MGIVWSSGPYSKDIVLLFCSCILKSKYWFCHNSVLGMKDDEMFQFSNVSKRKEKKRCLPDAKFHSINASLTALIYQWDIYSIDHVLAELAFENHQGVHSHSLSSSFNSQLVTPGYAWMSWKTSATAGSTAWSKWLLNLTYWRSHWASSSLSLSSEQLRST